MAANEAPPRANGAAPNVEMTQAPAYAWAEGIMDMIAKYDRNAERQLFVYGISVSRCNNCRSRLKANAKACANCNHPTTGKANACNRCLSPNPCIWCFECDVYFCEPCHLKPHVLVLGSQQPQHHCFPTDRAPGTMMHRAAWSDSLFSMALAARRDQLKQMKEATPVAAPSTTTSVEAPPPPAKTISNPPVLTTAPTSSAANTSIPPVQPQGDIGLPPVPPPSRQPTPPPVSQTTSTTSDSHRPATTSSARVISRSRSPSPVSSTTVAKQNASSVPRPSEPAPTQPQPIKLETMPTALPSSGPSKRKAPMVDLTSAGEEAKTDDATQPATPQNGAPSQEVDGMTLYERLRQMHSKGSRIKTEGQPAAPATPAISRPSLAGTPPVAQPAVRESTPIQHQAMHPTPRVPPQSSPSPVQPQQPAPSTTSEPPPDQSSSADADRELTEALSQTIEEPPAPRVNLATPGNQTMIANDLQRTPTASSGFNLFSGATSVEAGVSSIPEDPMKAVFVEEYDRVNEYIFKIELQIEQLQNYVRRASHSNVSHAAQISQRIRDAHVHITSADDQRLRALAKVVLFSPEILRFLRGLSSDKFFDNGIVLAANHKKCAELAKKIAGFHAELEAAKKAIEDAAGSGDVNQLIRLTTLTGRTNELKDEIVKTKRDRDSQFQLMVLFSDKLRQWINTEMTMIQQQRQAATRQ